VLSELLGPTLCYADQQSDDLFASGYELLRSGKSHPAAAKFEAGLKLDPNNALAHFYLGESYLALGRNAEAKKQYQKSLQLDPKSEVADDIKGRLAEARARAAKEEALRVTQPPAQVTVAQSTFSFINQCGERIWIAVLYQPLNQSDWKVSGWYELKPNSTMMPAVQTTNTNFYYYAYSENNKVWAGTGQEEDVKAEIIRGPAFDVTHSTGPTNLETVNFRVYPSGNTVGAHSQGLTCTN